jgi:polar amino acid transport system ATP-binding protein
MSAVLAVEGLHVERDGRTLVQGVTFSAARGERVALMGASGAGKTSVLRAIAGLEPRTTGAVTVSRTDAGDQQASGVRSRRHIGMVFQFHHLFDHLTALENVWLAPVHVARTRRSEAERHARALLEQLGVAHRTDARPGELSGGEAQRVAIARALAMRPLLLLMDEPTASLDPARRDELAATVRSLSADGTTILVATHDALFARGCVDRVLVMDEGRIVREGRPDIVLT